MPSVSTEPAQGHQDSRRALLAGPRDKAAPPPESATPNRVCSLLGSHPDGLPTCLSGASCAARSAVRAKGRSVADRKDVKYEPSRVHLHNPDA